MTDWWDIAGAIAWFLIALNGALGAFFLVASAVHSISRRGRV